jgi:sRNA-binding protein
VTDAQTRIDARAVWDRAQERFPGVRPRVALAVGCGPELLHFFRDVCGLSSRQARFALRWWFGGVAYLRACKAGATRFNLDGSTAGQVTAEEAAHAADRLRAVEKSRRLLTKTSKQKQQQKHTQADAIVPQGMPRYSEAPQERFNPATGRRIITLKFCVR